MEENERFQEAIKLVQLGHWEWNILTNSIAWSDEIYHIFGEDPQSFNPTYDSFLSYLSEEGQISLQKAVTDALNNKSHYSFIHKIHRKDGTECYVQELGQAKYDADDRPISMIGTVLDVTKQHEMEQKLKSLSDIVENSINEVYIFNPKSLYFTYVNDSVLKKLGYTVEEMKGMTPLDIKTNYTMQSFLTFIEPLLDESKKHLTFQTIHRCKNGSEYNVEIRMQSMERNGNQEVVVIAQDITDRVCWEEELKKLATTDSLTGIFNRHQTNNELNIEIERAKRYKSAFALVMFDLDDFKAVNDTYGHDVGDCVLKEVSTITQSHLRTSDRFGRWGGEEFLIILPELDQELALSVAKKIREAIAQYSFKGVSQITISVGVTVFNENDTNNSILKRVDDALYEAKHAGRNTVKFL